MYFLQTYTHIEAPLSQTHVYNFHNVNSLLFRSWLLTSTPCATRIAKSPLFPPNFTWKESKKCPYTKAASSWPSKIIKTKEPPCNDLFSQGIHMLKIKEHGQFCTFGDRPNHRTPRINASSYKRKIGKGCGLIGIGTLLVSKRNGQPSIL